MGEGSIIVRRIEPKDADSFRRIRLEALSTEPAAFASSYDDVAELTLDEWRQRINKPIFVAFQDGEPVGIVGLAPQTSRQLAHRASIVMVYVRKTARGTGVADHLLDAAVENARIIGIRLLELAVTAENAAAIRFYLRQGFVEVGRIPGGFLVDDREVDDILMVRRVPDAGATHPRVQTRW